ncbi:hypothetical protein HPB50_011995 [Hyalomma asiaticum]|uniref:Uncharacterized protein n=1 Tax=Hyalomma asiaticum TaxID=266040 RepID=A0ACB7SXV9_HYAAI|nr:hypothetical protein HPB50_011995 [Hyalomma asiaticum]
MTVPRPRLQRRWATADAPPASSLRSGVGGYVRGKGGLAVRQPSSAAPPRPAPGIAVNVSGPSSDEPDVTFSAPVRKEAPPEASFLGEDRLYGGWPTSQEPLCPGAEGLAISLS